MNYPQIFAQRMTKAMRDRDINQSILSYKTGIPKSSLSGYMHGRCLPKKEYAIKIAAALNVSTDYLYGTVTETNKKGINIPVIGYVAAGIPIEAISEVLDYEEISPDLARDGAEYFALRIKGDSMEPKISNGDVVIVRKQEDCDSGQIAIVCVNGDEATCKKVMKQNGGLLLVPFNSTHTPVFYSAEQVQNIPITIIGRVIELRAKF